MKELKMASAHQVTEEMISTAFDFQTYPNVGEAAVGMFKDVMKKAGIRPVGVVLFLKMTAKGFGDDFEVKHLDRVITHTAENLADIEAFTEKKGTWVFLTFNNYYGVFYANTTQDPIPISLTDENARAEKTFLGEKMKNLSKL